jgi:hypothetical protein
MARSAPTTTAEVPRACDISARCRLYQAGTPVVVCRSSRTRSRLDSPMRTTLDARALSCGARCPTASTIRWDSEEFAYLSWLTSRGTSRQMVPEQRFEMTSAPEWEQRETSRTWRLVSHRSGSVGIRRRFVGFTFERESHWIMALLLIPLLGILLEAAAAQSVLGRRVPRRGERVVSTT